MISYVSTISSKTAVRVKDGTINIGGGTITWTSTAKVVLTVTQTDAGKLFYPSFEKIGTKYFLAFNVVNTRHPFVNAIARFLHNVTAPALRPIQRVVPLIGGVDVSPLILALVLSFVQQLGLPRRWSGVRVGRRPLRR